MSLTLRIILLVLCAALFFVCLCGTQMYRMDAIAHGMLWAATFLSLGGFSCVACKDHVKEEHSGSNRRTIK